MMLALFDILYAYPVVVFMVAQLKLMLCQFNASHNEFNSIFDDSV